MPPLVTPPAMTMSHSSGAAAFLLGLTHGTPPCAFSRLRFCNSPKRCLTCVRAAGSAESSWLIRRKFATAPGDLRLPDDEGRALWKVPSGYRQDSRCLEPLHGEARGDILQPDKGDQPFVESVVTRDVGNHDAQHVVDLARHPVDLQHLRHVGDAARELL